MLCLGRYRDQWVRLTLPDGQHAWLGVDLGPRPGQIRLVIDAPSELVIERDELLPEDERRQRPQGRG